MSNDRPCTRPRSGRPTPWRPAVRDELSFEDGLLLINSFQKATMVLTFLIPRDVPSQMAVISNVSMTLHFRDDIVNTDDM